MRNWLIAIALSMSMPITFALMFSMKFDVVNEVMLIILLVGGTAGLIGCTISAFNHVRRVHEKD